MLSRFRLQQGQPITCPAMAVVPVSVPVSPGSVRHECRGSPAPTPDLPMTSGRMSGLVVGCSCYWSRRTCADQRGMQVPRLALVRWHDTIVGEVTVAFAATGLLTHAEPGEDPAIRPARAL